MNLFKRLKTRRQLKKSLKAHDARQLDIEEILSRDNSDNVVWDAYEYCMRKCAWDPSALSDSSVRDFLLCVLFEGEVNNGGIFQFLSNSSGDMSGETLLALEKIDETAAKVLREALRYFPNGIVPKDREERNDLIDQFDEKVAVHFNMELDEIIFEHDLSKSCYEFLQKHKEEFLCF